MAHHPIEQPSEDPLTGAELRDLPAGTPVLVSWTGDASCQVYVLMFHGSLPAVEDPSGRDAKTFLVHLDDVSHEDEYEQRRRTQVWLADAE